jgi:hypothetical protein
MPLFFMLVAVAITHRRAAWQFLSSRQKTDHKRFSIIKAG